MPGGQLDNHRRSPTAGTDHGHFHFILLSCGNRFLFSPNQSSDVIFMLHNNNQCRCHTEHLILCRLSHNHDDYRHYRCGNDGRKRNNSFPSENGQPNHKRCQGRIRADQRKCPHSAGNAFTAFKFQKYGPVISDNGKNRTS